MQACLHKPVRTTLLQVSCANHHVIPARPPRHSRAGGNPVLHSPCSTSAKGKDKGVGFVCHCLLVSSVIALFSFRHCQQVDSGTRWLLLTIDQGHPSVVAKRCFHSTQSTFHASLSSPHFFTILASCVFAPLFFRSRYPSPPFPTLCITM